jgi:tetratricopeptide (TPR) repeat protein
MHRGSVLTLMIVVPLAAAVGWWFYWPRYQIARAEYAVAQEDWAGAEAILALLVRSEPSNVRAHHLRAIVLRHLGRPAEGQASLKRAMDLGLDPAAGRREFALCEAAKGFTQNAERNLTDALREHPDDRELLAVLAAGCERFRRWEEADRYYTRLVELDPDDPERRRSRGRMRLTAVGEYRGRADEAADDFREVLRTRPDDFDARLALAQCLLSDARLAEAREHLQVCRDLRADRIEPLVGLGACALEERDYAGAEQLLLAALRVDADAELALTLLGDVFVRQQQFDRALPYYRRVIERDPRHRGARLKLAQALQQTGRPDEAKEHERIYRELLAESQRPPGP